MQHKHLYQVTILCLLILCIVLFKANLLKDSSITSLKDNIEQANNQIQQTNSEIENNNYMIDDLQYESGYDEMRSLIDELSQIDKIDEIEVVSE